MHRVNRNASSHITFLAAGSTSHTVHMAPEVVLPSSCTKAVPASCHITCTPPPPRHARRLQGTLTHMAPEMLMHGRCSKASDVYAFGILLWEVATGGKAFAGRASAAVQEPPPACRVCHNEKCWGCCAGSGAMGCCNKCLIKHVLQ
jgi:serine/threonine protein kinase